MGYGGSAASMYRYNAPYAMVLRVLVWGVFLCGSTVSMLSSVVLSRARALLEGWVWRGKIWLRSFAEGEVR